MVLIHGFTSDGTYLRPLAGLLADFGFAVAVFEYDSYLGIRAGAAALAERLDKVSAAVPELSCSLVGHSMGGLVAKYVAAHNPSKIRSVVTLATPHKPILASRIVVAGFIRASEKLSAGGPFARHLGCLASKELTGGDPDSVVDTLAKAYIQVPMLTVSAGLPFVEFGTNAFTNAVGNKLIQRLLKQRPNDGLVPEAVADGRRTVTGSVVHENRYSEYSTTNHTDVFKNQQVGLIVTKWLQKQHGVHWS